MGATLPEMEPSPPDDLADASAPVQEAARYVAQHRGDQRRLSVAMLLTMLSGLVGTALLHDLAGWSELASGIPLLVALLAVAGLVVWAVRGPLQHMPARQAMLQRYRALRELGLTATPDPAEASSAVERLCDRISALGGERPEVHAAVSAARQRVGTLQTERAHLAAMMAEDAALGATLAGVAERVEAEVARIRANLAETYAALLEVDSQGEATAAVLDDALARLRADGEVARAGARIRGTAASGQTQ
jgi:hypothetical protein